MLQDLLPPVQGVKRTKLGLREFIQLEAMLQDIDLEKKEAVRVVKAWKGKWVAFVPTFQEVIISFNPRHVQEEGATLPSNSFQH
eukprot:528313-Pelagomonas_calceolata.AAC.4